MACRPGTIADAKRGARMLLDFHKVARLPFHASGAWAHNLFCDCVTQPNRLAIMADAGLLLAITGPAMLGPFIEAHEIAWWVEPGSRGNGDGMRMLDTYEEWAAGQGAKIISVASMAALPAVESIYDRRGFVRLETHWVKVVN